MKPPFWQRVVVWSYFVIDDLFPVRAPFYAVGSVRRALRARAMKYMQAWRDSKAKADRAR
jgi:hypothetical protein